MKPPHDLRTEEGVLAFRDQLVKDFSEIEKDRPVMQHAILIVGTEPFSGAALPQPGVFALLSPEDWSERELHARARAAAAQFGALGVFAICRRVDDGVMLLTLDHATLGEWTWAYAKSSSEAGEYKGLVQLCEQHDIPDNLWAKRLLPARYMN